MTCERIEYTEHALRRLKERRISKDEVEYVLMNYQELLYDVEEKHYVFINYNLKLVVVADLEDNTCIVVTLYPSTKLGKLVAKRKRNKRWVEVEL